MVASAHPPAAPPPEPAPRRLLLVGADPALAGALRTPLRQAGHSVEQLPGPLGLDERIAAGGLDLIVLEPAPLPWPRALALCAAPRCGALLLLVSRLPNAALWAQLLEAGADVVLPKPVPPALLLAQVRAMLRRNPRHSVPAGPLPVTSEWALDETAGCLMGAQGERPLAPLELRVLRELMARPGEVVGRAELLAAVWGREAGDNADQVDQYICALRHKLEPDPKHPRFLVTVHGVGYRYRPPEGGASGS